MLFFLSEAGADADAEAIYNADEEVCCNCARRNDQCRYTASLLPWDRSRQEYVKALEERAGATVAGFDTKSNGPEDFPTSVIDQDWQGNTSPKPGEGEQPLSPNVTWALHLGQSSTAVFLREVQLLTHSKTSAPQCRRSVYSPNSGAAKSEAVVSDYLLPPRSIANHFFKLYWTDIFLIYPVLDWDRFKAHFADLYGTGQRTYKDHTTHCHANLIFALAEQRNFDKARATQGSEYFERARHLMNLDILGLDSFETVQSLVLCAQYMQSTENPRQCWTIVGLAIRAAQSIGLHLHETVEGLQPASDRQLARTVWNCVVGLDRSTSMTLGRRPTIFRRLSRPDEDDGANIIQNLSIQQQFFAQSTKLFDILCDILLSLYSEISDTTTTTWNMTDMFRLDKELLNWTSQLPEDLQIEMSGEAQHHACILRQRYLQIKMILLRPAILSSITSDPQQNQYTPFPTLEELSIRNCAIECVRAAKEMAELGWQQVVKDQVQDRDVPTTPWWYNIQFSYNAGTTLLAARLNKKITESIGVEYLENGLRECTQILTSYASNCNTALRCLAALSVVAQSCGVVLPYAEIQHPFGVDTDLPAFSHIGPFHDQDWLSLANLAEPGFDFDYSWALAENQSLS